MQKKLLFFQRCRWLLYATLGLLLLVNYTPVQGQMLTASLLDDKPVLTDPDQDQRKKSLKEVIEKLEESYTIKITYQSNIVDGKFIGESEYNKLLDTAKGNLEETLQNYIAPLGLNFKQYKDNYFIIVQQEDIPKIQKKLLNENKSLSIPAIEKVQGKLVFFQYHAFYRKNSYWHCN